MNTTLTIKLLKIVGRNMRLKIEKKFLKKTDIDGDNIVKIYKIKIPT